MCSCIWKKEKSLIADKKTNPYACHTWLDFFGSEINLTDSPESLCYPIVSDSGSYQTVHKAVAPNRMQPLYRRRSSSKQLQQNSIKQSHFAEWSRISRVKPPTILASSCLHLKSKITTNILFGLLLVLLINCYTYT